MEKRTVSYTLSTLPQLTDAQKAHLEALAAHPESEIDLSDIPAVSQEQWKHARRSEFYRSTGEPKRTGPATASSLNATWLRLTGRDQWIPTMARVYSSEYADLPEQVNSPVGYSTVVYSYSVQGELYTGKFVDFGRADESYFKRDDTVEIRYDPRHPAKSYYPEQRTQTNFRLLCAGIGVGLALIVVGISWWFHHGRI
jgi:hypothetical protein